MDVLAPNVSNPDCLQRPRTGIAPNLGAAEGSPSCPNSKMHSARTKSGLAFGQLKSQASRFASARRISGFWDDFGSLSRSALAGAEASFRVAYIQTYFRERRANVKETRNNDK
jgi:hypothetical protein